MHRVSKDLSQLGKYFIAYLRSSEGLDSLLANAKLVGIEHGKVTCELEIEERHCNRNARMHGGFAALLLDTITGAAILTQTTLKEEQPFYSGVSVALNVNYLRSVKLGEAILTTGKVDKMGKTLAFTSFEIVSKHDGKLIANGHHTKFLG